METLSAQFKKRLKSRSVKLSDDWSSKVLFAKPKNGKRSSKTFGDMYRIYCELHLPTLSESSRVMKLRRCEKFIRPIFDIKIQDFTAEVMNEFMIFTKENYYSNPHRPKKFNYDKQLKDIKSIFNFWIDGHDHSYYNPIRRSHFRMGVLEVIPQKERKISEAELLLFLSHLKQPYKDLAICAVYAAGRVGEIAGIQVKNIDLLNRKLHIKEVLVWIKNQPKVKNCPKNGSSRSVFINETMAEIFVHLARSRSIDFLLI